MTMVPTQRFMIQKDAAEWATEYSNAMCSMSPREEEANFKNVEIKFFYAVIPAVGCFVSDETLNEILSRKAIILIKAMDNNCFGYSLVFCINNSRSDKFNYTLKEGKPSASLKTDALN